MGLPRWYCAVSYSVAQSCLTLCDPMDCSPPGSSVHGNSPGKNTGVGCHAPPPGDCPNPGIKPRSPTLQADSLLSEPPGKPSLVVLVVKNLPANAGDIRDPWIRNVPRGGHDNPLQYSYLENPTNKGAWRAIVHRVSKSQAQLKRLSMHTWKDVAYSSLLYTRSLMLTYFMYSGLPLWLSW